MFEHILYILSIASYGFGKLNGLLPLTLTMIIIFILFFLESYKNLSRNKVFVLPKYLLVFLLVIVFSFLLNLNSISNDEMLKNIKFIIYFLIYFFVTWAIFRQNKIFYFLKLYIKFGILVAILAIIQYSLAQFGLDVGISISKGTLRATSIASEPSELGMYLLPLIYLALARIFKINEAKKYINLLSSYIILIASILTFSLIVYVYIFFITIFLSFRYKNIFRTFFYLVILFLIAIFAINNIKSISNRIDGLKNTNDLIYSDNISIIAVYSNYLIVEKSLNKHLFLGTSIGTHRKKYEENILDFYDKDFELNKDDASSMILRLLSELGIIGFIVYYSIFILHIFKYRNSKNIFLQEMLLISFLLYGLRYGSINTPMMWFFLVGYLSMLKKENKK